MDDGCYKLSANTQIYATPHIFMSSESHLFEELCTLFATKIKFPYNNPNILLSFFVDADFLIIYLGGLDTEIP